MFNFSDSFKKRESKLASKEEVYFSWWLDDAIKAGYVVKYSYEPEPLHLSDVVKNKYIKKLKTKNKNMEEKLLDKHVYTADFLIYWNDKARDIFFINENTKKQNNQAFTFVKENKSYVEIKGSFDNNNMTRLFRVNQKWVYDKLNVFVNLFKISNNKNSFFDKTFTPRRYLLTDGGGKKRKINYKPKNIFDYVKKK
jgi:hypothetical protein